MKVVVHKDRCSSSGNCAEIAASVFTQDERTGVVVLLQEHPSEALRQAVKRAELLCPTQAIEVSE